MKKFLKLVVVLLVVTILCGCGIKSEEEKIIKCISSQNNLANGYEIKSEYNIYTKGDAVKTVNSLLLFIAAFIAVLSSLNFLRSIFE